MTSQIGYKSVFTIILLLHSCGGHGAAAKKVKIKELPELRFLNQPDCRKNAKVGEAYLLQCLVDNGLGRATTVRWYHDGRLIAWRLTQQSGKRQQDHDAVAKNAPPSQTGTSFLTDDDVSPLTLRPVSDREGPDARLAINDKRGNLSVLTNGSLVIKGATVDANGKYYCNVTDDHQQTLISQSCRLTVAGSSPLSISSTSQIVHENGAVRLSCHSRHSPSSYTWNFNGRPLPQNNRLFYSPDAMQLTNASLSDSGRYQCCVSGSASLCSNETFVLVKIDRNSTSSPGITWIAKPRDAAVLRGAKSVLECLAEAKNALSYSWEKQVSGYCRNCLKWVAVPDDRRHRVDNGNLHLMDVREADAGRYRCSASDGRSTEQATAELKVISPPRITNRETSRTVRFLTRGSVRCIVEGSDPSDVNWYRNGVLIPKFPDRKLYSLYVWQTPSAATLKINYASLEHRGLYQCVAENSYGSDVFTMSIHLDKDTFTSPPEALTLVGRGQRSVNVTWLPPSGTNATTYLVLYGNSSEIHEEPLFDRPCDPWCHFRLTGLNCRTRYVISVSALTLRPPSLISPPIYVTTREGVPQLPVPYDVIRSEALGSNQLLLSWPPLSPSEACGEVIYYKINYGALEGGDYKLNHFVEVRVGDSSSSDKQYGLLTGLRPDTEYAFSIAPATRSGLSERRESFDFAFGVTRALPSNRSCSAESQNFTVSATAFGLVHNLLTISWDISATVPVGSFLLEVRKPGTDNVILAESISAAARQYNTTLLDLSSTFIIRLAVVFNNATTCLNASTAFLAGASYDGDAPVITSVVPLSSSELLVRWSYTPVWLPDQPIECYRVRYATVREGVGPDAPTLDSNFTYVTIPNLTAWTEYEVAVQVIYRNRVAGRDASSFSLRSVSAKTAATVPSVPTYVTAEASRGRLVVRWRPPASPGGIVTSYSVECRCSRRNAFGLVTQTRRTSGQGRSVAFDCLESVAICRARVAAATDSGPGPYAAAKKAVDVRKAKISAGCPPPSLTLSTTTTTTAMSKPPVNPRAVGIGFGIVLAFICMGFLVLFCCCCSRKRDKVLDKIKCPCCASPSNTLKQCKGHSHIRPAGTNSDSGICMAPPGVQAYELQRLTMNGGPAVDKDRDGPMKQERPTRNGFHKTKNGFHNNQNGFHINQNGFHINQNGFHSNQNVFHTLPNVRRQQRHSTSSAKAARVGGNQHQGGLNVLQILFNKEPRAGAKVAYRKASVTSRSENTPILSVPIPQHSKIFNAQQSSGSSHQGQHLLGLDLDDDIEEVTNTAPVTSPGDNDDDDDDDDDDVASNEGYLSSGSDTSLLIDIVRSLPRLMPQPNAQDKVPATCSDTSNYSSQSNSGESRSSLACL